MYWTKAAAVGGHIEKEEDFIVDEIPLKKFFSKYVRSKSGIKPVKGPYTLALLKKKGMTTRDALKIVAKKFGLKKSDIGYAGLKDAFAITSQYITVKGNLENIKTDRLEIAVLGHTRNMMQVGESEGNKFCIRLHGCKIKNIPKVIDELTIKGIPNYFGPQRFGIYGDNHKIGKLVLQCHYDPALRLIKKHGRKKNLLINVDKKFLKFFIHAYQSFIFNKVLGAYISNHSTPYFDTFPIVGLDTNLKNDFAGREIKRILKRGKISLKDFSIRALRITCKGSSRPAFVKIKKIDYKTDGKDVTLKFALPKGSYATVLLREVTKTQDLFKASSRKAFS